MIVGCRRCTGKKRPCQFPALRLGLQTQHLPHLMPFAKERNEDAGNEQGWLVPSSSGACGGCARVITSGVVPTAPREDSESGEKHWSGWHLRGIGLGEA